MKTLKTYLVTIFALLVLLLPQTVLAESKFIEGSVDVNNTPLYLRADETSPVVCELPEGTRVGVYDEQDGFARIIYGNYRGYMKREMLFVPSEDSFEASAYSNVNVRQSPGTYSNVLVEIKEDTPVEILDSYPDWYQVKILAKDCGQDTDVKGYIAKEFLLITPTGQENTLLKLGMSGSRIKTMQKELKSRGFLSASATGYFGPATKQALADFQVAAKLSPDGIAGLSTLEVLYGDNNIKAVVKTSSSGGGSSSSGGGSGVSTGSGGGRIHLSNPSAATRALVGKVYGIQWNDMNGKWPRGKVATVTVVATGAQFNVVRGNTTLHADCTPVSASDTATMKAAYGGSWKWARCPIWVTLGGTTYAASMNGMPHDKDYSPSSGFGGHFCIHFSGSQNHNTGAPDKDHQAAVNFAYNAAQ